MRARVVATYVTVAVVNATAGVVHLADGEGALGWAFILATVAFLLLGWEAEWRLAVPRSAEPADEVDEASLALFDLPEPVVAPRPAHRRARPKPSPMRRLAWLSAIAIAIAMELRLVAGAELGLAAAVAAAVVAGGMAPLAPRLLAPLQRRTP